MCVYVCVLCSAVRSGLRSGLRCALHWSVSNVLNARRVRERVLEIIMTAMSDRGVDIEL